MGYRSCIVRHRPTTLPGAPSRTRAHRRLGRADKKRGPSRSPRSPTTSYVVSVLEGRRPGGSIGAALRSIVFRSHDGSIVEHFRPIFTPSGFGESPVRPRGRLTAGRIDRSTTTAVVFDAKSGKSINEFVESSVHRRQARAPGIPVKHRACESISEFKARSRVLEEPGGPTTNAERSSGSINTLIPSSIAGLSVRSYLIRFVKSIWKNNRINRPTGIVVDLEKRFPITARPILPIHRPSDEQTITRVGHLSIRLSGSINLFFQPAIPETIESHETSYSSFSSSSSRGSLILVAVPFRAAAMTFRRRTSFR